jgi:hypothetical protein
MWWLWWVAIIVAGIASRVVHSGSALIDKYLGDALYAAMAYVIFRLVVRSWPVVRVATLALAAMTAIELFQLTLIPARLLSSGSLVIRIAARLMGTEFSFLDLLAYAVGIGCVAIADRVLSCRNALE